MSFIKRETVAITTDGSGDATGYTAVVTGLIQSIKYTKTDYADGVDFTITTEDTAQGVWAELNVNATAQRSPGQAAHDLVGVASLYEAGQAVERRVAVANERIKIVIANGGITKSGTFDVLIA